MSDSPDPPRDDHPRRRAPRRLRAITPSPAMLDGCPPFAPVPRPHARHDGWTPERQQAFIVALMATGCVRLACERIGMASEGAYMLRRQPGAEDFARAWAEAQAVAVEALEDVAFERARHGVPVPIFHAGEQVGEKRWYNDRLLMWTLRHHAPDRYGVAGSAGVTPQTRRALHRQWEEERAQQQEAQIAELAAEEKRAFEDDGAAMQRYHQVTYAPKNDRERRMMLLPVNIIWWKLLQWHGRVCADASCGWRDDKGDHHPFYPRLFDLDELHNRIWNEDGSYRIAHMREVVSGPYPFEEP